MLHYFSVRIYHEDGRDLFPSFFGDSLYPVYHQKGSNGKVAVQFYTPTCPEMNAEKLKIILHVHRYKDEKLLDTTLLEEIKLEDPYIDKKLCWTGIHEFKKFPKSGRGYLLELCASLVYGMCVSMRCTNTFIDSQVFAYCKTEKFYMFSKTPEQRAKQKRKRRITKTRKMKEKQKRANGILPTYSSTCFPLIKHSPSMHDAVQSQTEEMRQEENVMKFIEDILGSHTLMK